MECACRSSPVLLLVRAACLALCFERVLLQPAGGCAMLGELCDWPPTSYKPTPQASSITHARLSKLPAVRPPVQLVRPRLVLKRPEQPPRQPHEVHARLGAGAGGGAGPGSGSGGPIGAPRMAMRVMARCVKLAAYDCDSVMACEGADMLHLAVATRYISHALAVVVLFACQMCGQTLLHLI